MKFVPFALTLLLAPFAAAGSGDPGGSEEQANAPELIFYDPIKGKQREIFLKCANYSRSLTNCPFPEPWEQTNALKGLQTSPVVIRNRVYPADACLLPGC